METINCYFGVSKVCNLKCKYCYVPMYNKRDQRDYNEKALTAARQFVTKIKSEKQSITSITLHGAEPTVLSAQTLGEVVSLFAQPTNGDVRMQSNGTRLTSDYIDALLKVIKDPDVLFMGISMDGSASIHNPQRNQTWDLVMQNILALKERGFSVGILGVVTPLTLNHLADFERWVEDLTPVVDTITFKLGEHGFGLSEAENVRFANWLYDTGNIKHLQAFIPSLCMHDGNACSFYEFDVDGSCYSCNKNYNADGIFANWFEDSFEQIIARRKNIYADVPIDPECLTCPYHPVCRSGCPLSREHHRSVDCLVKKTIYPRLLQQGLDSRSFFAGEHDPQRHPALAELADYERLRLTLAINSPEHVQADPESHLQTELTDAVLILNPSLEVRRFQYPVHLLIDGASVDDATPEETELIVYKDPKSSEVHSLVVNPLIADIVRQFQRDNTLTVGEVLEESVPENLMHDVLASLQQFYEKSVILSFGKS